MLSKTNASSKFPDETNLNIHSVCHSNSRAERCPLPHHDTGAVTAAAAGYWRILQPAQPPQPFHWAATVTGPDCAPCTPKQTKPGATEWGFGTGGCRMSVEGPRATASGSPGPWRLGHNLNAPSIPNATGRAVALL